MPDLDPTPESARPSAKGRGGAPGPESGPRGGGADPPTVRTAPASSLGPVAAGPAGRRPGFPIHTAPLPLPLPGDRIDVFELEEAIGAGGMGAVFRAVDTKLDRMVALKILPPDQAVDPEVVLRYHQEGRAAARLDHENIARVYSIGDDGRYHYIVFEYIEGTTIRQRVERDGPLPVGDAINYTLQIANALVHAAARAVVHRDIKPSNIIVTPQGRAKLVDMGLARRFERGQDGGLTQSGMTLGTFDYISPEQARDPRDVDVRGDLYSLGCTLYHMLSGRPPFPDGTVLQKLLQHQEEQPLDIRELNPSVPDDLAAILAKLMAKDRDRRYQTPEQLVRDLLTVAGSLGLRSLNPEGLVWMAPAPPPAWVRHAFWGLPALAFLVILAGLALWGDGPAPTPPRASADNPPIAPAPVTPTKAPTVPPKNPSTQVSTPTAPAAPAEARVGPDAAPILPREYSVGPDDDLIGLLASAPPRSTVLLSSKGPYDLRGPRARRLAGLDVTIKAEMGVRPVIRLPRAPTGLDPRPAEALLEIAGGHVALDGLDFVVDQGGGRDEVAAAIRIEGGEVSIRRCGFRTVASSLARSKPAAILIKPAPRGSGSAPWGGERGASLVVDASDFDGGQAGILASGLVDVSVRDCTFGPAPAALATFWSENPEGGAVPAEFRLAHVSVLAGPGPVFRFGGTAPRVRVFDSAFAPPAGPPLAPPATLVAIDVPDRLDWRGAGNLYGRIAVYLRPGGLPPSTLKRAEVRTFAAWGDDPSTFREAGSTATDAHPWDEPNPLDALAAGSADPLRAYRLTLPRPASNHPGARQGPAGLIPSPTLQAAQAVAPNQTIVSTTPEPALPESRPEPIIPPRPGPVGQEELAMVPPEPAPAREQPARPGTSPGPGGIAKGPTIRMLAPPPGRSPDPRDDELDEFDLVPMPMPAPPDPDLAPISGTNPAAAGPPGPAPATMPSRPPEGPQAGGPVAPSPLIQSVDQFLDALDRPASGPRTLTLAAGADLTLPSRRLRGTSTWLIRAEPGATRPRVRFRPEPADPLAARDWAAWLTLAAGQLHLQGIDLVVILPAEAAPGVARPVAAFAIKDGSAELTLDDCTVTIEGSKARSAVAALLARDPSGPLAEPANPAIAAVPAGPEPVARVRFKNCLLRLGDDGVDVASGRLLDLDVANAAVATGGALVHGHGVAEGRAPGPIKLAIRQVAARVAGGLVRLESTPGEPELPKANVVAGESVLATVDPDAPLLRVDGQGELDPLRDRVEWEGRSVAYHQINIYRRDQTSQPGVAPHNYIRDSWDLAAGLDEEASIHGDLNFLADWPADRAPWTLRPDDLRLGPASPAAALGPDFLHIPSPPPGRSS